MSRTVEIRRAAQAAEFEAARRLLLEYRAAIGGDLCFQGFQAELADLPGRYRRPGGGLWLAWAGALPLGCVALAPAGDNDPSAGELRRLYVRPHAHGSGLGRALVESVLAAAQAAGYATVRLESLTRFTRANALYDALGFVEVPDFTDERRAPGTRFMTRALREADRPARRQRQLGAQLG